MNIRIYNECKIDSFFLIQYNVSVRNTKEK